MEEKITFESGPCRLEGYWQAGTAAKGVVITHPHPLYGGNMRNPVVESVQSIYQKHGYGTLRFNFRGVGSSQGHYDNGAGEQDDVRAAIAFVRHKALPAVDLAGYSFGAWINAGVAAEKGAPIESMMMVSPPVEFIEFENITFLSCLDLVITGSRDGIAPAHRIRDLLPTWNPDAQFEVINGCDHFYSGYLEKLESILDRYLESTKPDPA
ncbi:MAG: CocE/NonD family hydrolase [Desulfobacterales bacterium]|jgi:alpha/beta superfamily hydrolase